MIRCSFGLSFLLLVCVQNVWSQNKVGIYKIGQGDVSGSIKIEGTAYLADKDWVVSGPVRFEYWRVGNIGIPLKGNATTKEPVDEKVEFVAVIPNLGGDVQYWVFPEATFKKGANTAVIRGNPVKGTSKP